MKTLFPTISVKVFNEKRTLDERRTLNSFITKGLELRMLLFLGVVIDYTNLYIY